MSFIGVPECGNVCAGPVVFSLSAPGPGLPSHKVPQLWTGHCRVHWRFCGNMYGRQLVINWMVSGNAKLSATGRVVCK